MSDARLLTAGPPETTLRLADGPRVSLNDAHSRRIGCARDRCNRNASLIIAAGVHPGPRSLTHRYRELTPDVEAEAIAAKIRSRGCPWDRIPRFRTSVIRSIAIRLVLAAALTASATQGCGSTAPSPRVDSGLCQVRAELTRAHGRLIEAMSAANANRLDDAASAAADAASIAQAGATAMQASEPPDRTQLRFILEGAAVNIAVTASIFTDQAAPATREEMLRLGGPAIKTIEATLSQADDEVTRLSNAGLIACR